MTSAMGIFDTASTFLRDHLPKLAARVGNANSVVVLEIALEFLPDATEVEFDLGQYGALLPADRRTWRLPIAALQASNPSAPTASQLELPLQLTEGLRASLADMQLGAEQPLWLDLKRPYGNLGVLPWERALGGALGRPILRLPDLLQPPHENTDVLDAAILFDPPMEGDEEKTAQQAIRLASSLMRGSSRLQTTVHIFAGAGWHDRLKGQSLPTGTRLHDPAGAETSKDVVRRLRAGETPTRTSTWTNWISHAVKGRSIDVIHFVGDAGFTDSGSGLFLSSSPSPKERMVVPILADVDEITAMLTGAGAWGAMFSPTEASGEIPMAYLADALSHARPGPVLYHLAASEDANAIEAAYRLLFASSAVRAPSLTRGFVYCYPPALSENATDNDPLSDLATLGLDLIQRRAPLSDRLRTTFTGLIPLLTTHVITRAPSWVGAAQRYSESAALDQARRAAPDVLLSRTSQGRRPESEKSADPGTTREALRARQDALADVQNVIKTYLQKSGGN